jgi:hypothetical protein
MNEHPTAHNHEQAIAERPTEPSFLVRNHGFILNREKQTANLAQDTAIDDFEITVNNKDANVNIKCSTGFYATVARPAMSSFLQGTQFNVENVIINCFHVAFNRDQTGVEESRVLHLGLGDLSLQAKVTISLHHTARLLQIQGGSKMHDGSKAATWFLESYVKQKFDYQAKIMKYDITKFNEAITEMFSTNATTLMDKQGNSCSHCLKPFKSNSVPVLCPLCLKQTHKSRCKPC